MTKRSPAVAGGRFVVSFVAALRETALAEIPLVPPLSKGRKRLIAGRSPLLR